MARLSVSVVFNNQTYNLTYNDQTGYYEATLTMPNVGGIYEAEATFYDIVENEVTDSKNIQVLEKEPIQIDINKNFVWIFDYRTFAVKDIVEIASYEIISDEETNQTSTIKVLKNTTASAMDIIAVKRNNDIIYWGIITEIQNENGANSYVYVCKYITNMFDRKVALIGEEVISTTGIEAFLQATIEYNFKPSTDSLLALSYLAVRTYSLTPIQASVSNVENGLFNLHTFMTNCTQNYGVVYKWNIINSQGTYKLRLTIYIPDNQDTELIDVKAMNITNYNEVFETDIVAKVEVYAEVQGAITNVYNLYLKNDRTTTTNAQDTDRAFGKTEAIFVEDSDNAPQEALNVFKGNSYNHNISFSLDRYIPLGTPIAIKTQKSIVYNTYISSVKMTSSKFFDYQCGNIRINFIEKLLKERNN